MRRSVARAALRAGAPGATIGHPMERERKTGIMRPAAPRRSLLAAIAPLIAGNLSPRAAAAQSSVAPAAAAEWRFGALYPLSGALALLGDESYRGLEMAVEERNAAGGLLGRPIRLIRADANDQAAAVNEARRLMGQERVSVLFGTYGSTLSFAATQVSEAQGIPFFELGAIADSITERGFRNLYRTCPRASDFARVSAEAVAEILPGLLGIPRATLRVAILHEDGLYGTSVAEFQAARLREANIQLVEGVAYPTRTADLGPAVQRLREASADVLLHTAGQNDVVLLFRTLREAGWRPRMIMGSGAGYSLTDTARTLGRAMDGVMNVDFTQYAIAERLAPGNAAFAEAYKRRYGSDPRSGHSLANHFGARIAFDAIQRAGGTEKDRLRAAVLATTLPEGDSPTGWGAAFDERGQNMRARPWLAQWQDGRLVTIHPEAAAVAPPRSRLGND
ncbi:ABC transporter substrate-binding protein [Roseomonas sp. SSH11]|uniref:ABC transporter substrate-binding protein n=1 Tax=Pararoseomonas baculiformis TaxID=2820812 RepID=A0ABS4ADW5_9PROT|nr:ABC transporter substrate-binding protein [Pararoseomonas baculiformis]MBP0445202.1 ABC transporter substrate-binding protein [Pararoseomonas baculiformis]